ncbi:hypothetical protein Pyn_08515 [Prunus yedoensis var. nudiflora]|uniref:Uncharacterized protein n=1 Tax=Prunus yedoensis var. nudiflora TaxID=2094558 RepID=A0A314ZTN2_PRUYE|nr:hypothetical protein Pyn_08515 [Prunus yedoensis var. nudiflora]
MKGIQGLRTWLKQKATKKPEDLHVKRLLGGSTWKEQVPSKSIQGTKGYWRAGKDVIL